MFKNEEQLKQIMGRLKIDTTPSLAHKEFLRNEMIGVFESGTRIRSVGIDWRKIMQSKYTKIAAAAVIIIAIFLTLKNINGSTPAPERQIVKPDRQVTPTDEQPQLTQQDQPDLDISEQLQTELSAVEKLYADKDVKALISTLKTGSKEAKILSANYLAALGAEEAIEPLTELSSQWTGTAQADPFALAVEQILKAAQLDPNAAGSWQDQSNLIDDENRPYITITVLDKANNTPLEGFFIKAKVQKSGADDSFELFTDKQGQCKVEITNPEAKHVDVECSKDGFVAQNVFLQRTDEDSIHPECTFYMEPAVEIGGIVTNEQSEPIENAVVYVSLFDHTERVDNQPRVLIRDNQFKTDKDGKWVCAVLPQNFQRIGIRLSHPGYVDDRYSSTYESSNNSLHNKSLKLIMKKGVVLTGYVYDENGNPISGASVIRGESKYTEDHMKRKTDDAGKFDFGYVLATMQTLTAQKKGFAPELVEITASADAEAVQMFLGPGYTIKGRVADVNGVGIPEVGFAADEWKGYRTIDFRSKTDDSGRFEWNGAPAEEVKIAFFKKGYMDIRDTSFVPSDTPYEVVMYPELRVSGKVVDAETKEAIKEFNVLRGIKWENNDRVSWQRDSYNMKSFTDGKYTMSFTYPYPGHLIRIEADGYLPAVSKVFKSDEAKQSWDFELQKGTGPAGVVFTPEESPAESANVCVITKNQNLYIENGNPRKNNNNQIVIDTDGKGKFAIPPQTEAYKLLVLHESGYAEISEQQFADSNEIFLQKWAQAEGYVFIGSKPAADQQLNCQCNTYQRDGFNYNLSFKTTSDANGYYLFEKVQPGRNQISRVIRSSDMRRSWYVDYKNIETFSGEKAYADIGGEGRVVTGQLLRPDSIDADLPWECADVRINTKRMIDEQNRYQIMVEIYNEIELPRPENFEAMTSSDVMQWFQDWARSEEGQKFNEQFQQKLKERMPEQLQSKNYNVMLESDGSFEVTNVTAGDYTITAQFYGLSKDRYNRKDYNNRLGNAVWDFTVAEITDENIDIPYDLGDIHLEMQEKAAVGKTPDDFTVKTFNGKTISLSQYRGKFVLLVFWMFTGQPQIDAKMDQVVELYDTYKADERIEFVGLTMTPGIQIYAEIAEKYITEKNMTFPQGQLDYSDYQLFRDFGGSGYPHIVLIGPDGKVVETGIKAEELADKIVDAME